MPVAIPVEVVPVLESMGIKDAPNCRWKCVEPWPIRRTRAHAYCECAAPVKGAAGHLPPGTPVGSLRVELTFTWLANRRVFIGQCRNCGTIYSRCRE